ncbi:MAG: hypothetical protein KBG15_13095 [Kofleriaceae bacterium]|nr:hypothetical protein [Kofleriaceae bacterium]
MLLIVSIVMFALAGIGAGWLLRRRRARRVNTSTLPVISHAAQPLAAGPTEFDFDAAVEPLACPWLSTLILHGIAPEAELHINGAPYQIIPQHQRGTAATEEAAPTFHGFFDVPPGRHRIAIASPNSSVTFYVVTEPGAVCVRHIDMGAHSVREIDAPASTTQTAELVDQLMTAEALHPWPRRAVYVIGATTNLVINGHDVSAAPFVAALDLTEALCTLQYAGINMTIQGASMPAVLEVRADQTLRVLSPGRGPLALQIANRTHGWPVIFTAHASGELRPINQAAEPVDAVAQ